MVQLAECMGGESSIIDQARICYLSHDRATEDGDQRLLKQLITADLIHGTPLRAMQMRFRVKLPLFVMRQWTRHIIANHYDVLEFSTLGQHTFDWGGSFDEMSGRYVDFRNRPEFYDPTKLRPNLSFDASMAWREAKYVMQHQYMLLRESGIPKELARCMIPQSIYTYMNWSVNLQGVMTWYEHRKKGSGAQLEHIRYAEAVLALVEIVAPNAAKHIRERAG